MDWTSGGSIHGKGKISSLQNVCTGCGVQPACYSGGIGEERPKREVDHWLPLAVLIRRPGLAEAYTLRHCSVSLDLTCRSGVATGHLHIVPRLRIGGVMSQVLYTFMACTGTTLPLPVPLLLRCIKPRLYWVGVCVVFLGFSRNCAPSTRQQLLPQNPCRFSIHEHFPSQFVEV